MNFRTLEVKHTVVVYKLFLILVNSSHDLYKMCTNFAGCVNFASGNQERKKNYLMHENVHTKNRLVYS